MLSKLKKKLKSRLPEGKHKPDGTGADADGERVDATGSIPQPEPHVVADGDHPDVEVAVGGGPRREGNSADGERVKQASSSQSSPSLVRGGKSDGM
jgi:hypothetical protein